MARVLRASLPGGEVPQPLDTHTIRDRIREAIAGIRHEPVEPGESVSLIELRTQQWASQFGLVTTPASEDRFAQIRCGSCASHTYQNMPVEIIEIGAALIGWLFLFDDRYGESGDLETMTEVFAACRSMLDTGQRRPSKIDPAFYASLFDLRERVAALADPAWLRRFSENMGRYFSGCMFEFPFRQAGKPPSLAAYRRLRPWSIGTLAVFDLIELTTGSPPDAPHIDQLRELGAALCAWTNDIHSYTKEVRNRDPLNLIAVLLNERDEGLEDALDVALAIYHEDFDHFSRTREAIENAPDATPEEVAYARGVSAWVHGNAAWTKLSGRYHTLPMPPEASHSERRIKLDIA